MPGTEITPTVTLTASVALLAPGERFTLDFDIQDLQPPYAGAEVLLIFPAGFTPQNHGGQFDRLPAFGPHPGLPPHAVRPAGLGARRAGPGRRPNARGAGSRRSRRWGRAASWAVRVYAYRADGSQISYFHAGGSRPPEDAPAAYQARGGAFTTPADAASVKVMLLSEMTSGWLAFDEVSLTKGGVSLYYYAGGERVAMRHNGLLYWLAADHLGSTSKTAINLGSLYSELRYKPWGEARYSSSTTPTSFRFTGQRAEPQLGGADGLYYYNARWYDPYITQFSQPDSIIPDPYNPLDWNRYAYARYNPVRYSDPSGHMAVEDGDQGPCKVKYCGWIPPVKSPDAIGNNALDSIPVVSNVRGMIRGSQTSMWASQQAGFGDQQAALQTWYNNCYGLCHYADAVVPGSPNTPIGGPMTDVPLVDTYSQGMGEAVNGAVGLVIDFAFYSRTTNIWTTGGKKWHVGWQTNDEWSIIHVGTEGTANRGIHLAIGSIGPRKAFLHIYLWPEFRFWIPGVK
jgi:RHS repeat-associated protein